MGELSIVSAREFMAPLSNEVRCRQKAEKNSEESLGCWATFITFRALKYPQTARNLLTSAFCGST